MNFLFYFILFVFITIIISLLLNCNEPLINSDSNSDNKPLVELYVLHLERSIDRIENITKQQTKTKYKINYFNAVDGFLLDIKNLLDNDIIDKNYYKCITNPAVYGCYMSHYNLIEELLNKYENNLLHSKYSIIFEDDFNILDNFDNNVLDVINNINNVGDFDIIFLGNSSADSYNQLVINNIYTIRTNNTAEAYLINNKNLKKIYNQIKYINEAIDWKYSLSIMNNLLIGYTVYPSLVIQQKDYKSLIDNL